MLLQIETDKVTIDVRYTETQPGKIREFLVSEDDTVTVGQQVCIVEKGNTEGGQEGEALLFKGSRTSAIAVGFLDVNILREDRTAP